MKTEAQLMIEYKANDFQLMAAFENAMMLMQDKYGFDTVTREFLENAHQNNAEYAEWVEASLESIVQSGHLA